MDSNMNLHGAANQSSAGEGAHTRTPLKLNRTSITERGADWEAIDFALPQFDIEQMVRQTHEHPSWIHFGSGNIFRAFIAPLQQELLNRGAAQTGIIAVGGHDFEVITRAYRPYDNLSIVVLMHPDGRFEKTVLGSVAETLLADPLQTPADWSLLGQMFANPSLQMVSFTITEKGYVWESPASSAGAALLDTPTHPQHLMAKIAALLLHRYQAGAHLIALVSMDNCSGNGDVLKRAVTSVADYWMAHELSDANFLAYLNDTTKVAFPWTMIDKITPRPSQDVAQHLTDAGIDGMHITETTKHSFVAPFVNAEVPGYLIVEDDFPAGRPPLEQVGVLFTNRDTVNKVEKMKVTTCLNPLHTALAIFGCLLGHKSIAEAMQDAVLHRLVTRLGHDEGLPVAPNPGILNPADFLNEVLNERFPNPNIPDTPQRIASDTSQKMPIRFGETLRTYQSRFPNRIPQLISIPLVIAGWCRYLLAVDDEGHAFDLSPDPLLPTLRPHLAGLEIGSDLGATEIGEGPADVELEGTPVEAGEAHEAANLGEHNSDDNGVPTRDPALTASVHNRLEPILSDANLFGVDLYAVGLAQKVEMMFTEMIRGPHAVRHTLEKYL